MWCDHIVYLGRLVYVTSEEGSSLMFPRIRHQLHHLCSMYLDTIQNKRKISTNLNFLYFSLSMNNLKTGNSAGVPLLSLVLI